MKHFYLSLITFLIVSISFSQNKLLPAKPGSIKKATSQNLINPSKGAVVKNKAILFSDDFATGAATWSVSGSDGNLWQQDFDGPSGEIAIGSPAITSTTSGNGFMIFDADLSNPGGGGALRSGSLESPVIDLTGKTNITIKSEHDYAYCCNSSFFLKLEVSTDDFFTFQTFDVGDGTPVNTLSGTFTTTTNIASFLIGASNLSNFRFRFNFDGSGGTSHYFWQLDDVEVYDSPSFDLKLNNVFWGSTGDWTTAPTFQVPTFQIAPILFEGEVANNGSLDQTDVVFTATSASASYAASTSPSTIVAGDTSYLIPATLTLPAILGTYTISCDASSSNVDGNPSDNVFPDFDIEVTSSVLAMDNGLNLNSIYNSGLAYEYGNVFNIFSNSTLVNAQIGIDNATNAGAIIYAKLYEMDPNAADLASAFIPIDQTADYTVAAGDLGFVISLPFTIPPTLTAGKSYALMVGAYGDGGSTNDLVVMAGGSSYYATIHADLSGGVYNFYDNTAIVRMELAQFTAPVISSSDADNTVCAGQTVTLTSSEPTGNVWSTGATTQSITVNASGTYSVTANSLTSTSVTVTVNALPATPTISASGSTTFCSGGSVTLTSSAASGNLWSTGATTQSITVSTAGNYSVTRTVSACSATSTTTTVNILAAPATPTISASGATTFCSGGSVTLTSSAASGNTWSTGATTQSITVSSSGNYTVTNTVSGCSATSLATTVVVNSNPGTPTISASGSTTFCSGQFITLSSSAASGNIWSTGETTQTIMVTTAGNYSVTQTVSGCSATSSITTVVVNATPSTPTISASGATTFCSGGSVVLTSSSASGNAWSNGSTTQSITVSSSGSYTVTNTVSACSATSAVTNVTVNANPSTPTISASGSTTFCSGQSITLTSSAASGNTWSTGATTQAITVTTAGNYSVTQTVSGCSATSAIQTVTVNPTPSVPTISASGATTFCSGSSVTLTSSSATNNFWNTGATSQSITVSTAGNYGVTVSQSGCSATSTLTAINVNTSPVITTGTTINPIACGSTSGSIQVNGSGTGNVNWSGTAAGVAPGVTLPYIITGLGSGSYAVSFVDGNGCTSNTLTPSLSDPGAPPAPTISSSGSTSFCIGGSVILTSSSASGNTWSTGETTQSITVSSTASYFVTNTVAGCSSTSTATSVIVNALPTVNAGTYTSVCQNAADIVLNAGSPSGGTYSGTGVSGGNFDPSFGTQSILYLYTDGNGCTNNSTATITVLSLPSVNAGADQTICPGGSVTLNGSGAPSLSWDQGVINGVAFNPASTTTYTLTGIGANGCSNTDFATVTIESLPVIAMGTITSPSTCGSATGSIQVLGAASGTLSWTGTASGSQAASLPASIPNLAAGTYTIDFNSTTGCPSNTIVQSLSDPGAPSTPTISASGATTFCSGGSVTLTSSAASGNLWSTGATTQSITVSSTGSYTVAVTVSGCTANSAATSVTVNAFPSIALGSVVNPLTCGTNTGSIQITGSGTGNLSWSGAASGSLGGVSLPITISNLGAGSYSINFNDGCPSNTLTSSLSDVGVVVPIISASGATTFCSGASVTLTSSVASGITWSTGATSQSITVNSSGSYSVTNTIASCTASSLPTTVTVNAIPTVNAGADQSVCSGTAVTLSAVSSDAVSWDNGVADGVSFIPGTTTIYTVVASASSGCVATDQVLVTVNASPTVNAGADQTVCSGTAVTLLAVSSDAVSWDNGVTDGVSFVPLTTVTYTVVATASGGCTATDQVLVTVNASPTVAAGADQAVCSGTAVTLSAVSSDAVSWDNGVTDGVSFVPATTAIYTVVATTSGGCTATDQVLVMVNAVPTILTTAINPTSCSGTDGSIVVGGTGTGDISWSGTASGVSNGISLPFTISSLSAGSYTVSFTSLNGCNAIPESKILTDPGAPAAPTISAAGSTTFCAGGNVVLTSSEATGITWSTGETTASITVSASGNYNVSFNVGGCVSTSVPMTITVTPIPTISLGATSDPTSCATLTGSIEVLGSGTGTVSWSGTAAGSQIGTSLPFTITGLGSGSYSIIFNDGCTSTPITGSISDPGAPATPVISSTGSTFCVGDSVILTSSATTGITWSTGESTTNIIVKTGGNYFVTASAGSCSSTSAMEAVVVNSLPTVNGGADLTVCAGGSVTLTATASSAFAWDNGVIDAVAFVPTDTMNYVVTATDLNSCSATDTVMVTVNALPVITFDPIAQVCVYNTAVALIATPTGGVFSGTGVSGSNFDPAGLAVGTYTASYDVTVNGCSATATQGIVVDSCLSINEYGINVLTVYPNPTQGSVTIKGSQLNKFDYVAVKDQLGRLVIGQQAISGEAHELNLSELVNGTYYLVITGENSQQIHKIEILR